MQGGVLGLPACKGRLGLWVENGADISLLHTQARRRPMVNTPANEGRQLNTVPPGGRRPYWGLTLRRMPRQVLAIIVAFQVLVPPRRPSVRSAWSLF